MLIVVKSKVKETEPTYIKNKGMENVIEGESEEKQNGRKDEFNFNIILTI